ncbi:hypothetical protein [Serratia marcescens]|uniref:hypothetical protein n=1 Tax=Serratia marcescens TaxID=615 RepID=UPI000B601A37|nr:hypothetical protein [Serratia marcescens]ASL92285.1 hypothetical protein BVG94_06300 [Serratia marcescens]CAI0809108.1 Uncharacterised protein [Serratia marcescens]CAI2431458.1 Uncharacterised protein [Serratia marcescens]
MKIDNAEKFKMMLRDESIDDLLTVLAPKMPLHRLDPLMIRSRVEDITNTELIESFDRLYDAGILMTGESGGIVKGPNWREPEFVTNKKYE